MAVHPFSKRAPRTPIYSKTTSLKKNLSRHFYNRKLIL